MLSPYANALTNGMFILWDNGTGPFTTTATETANKWNLLLASSGAATVNRITFSSVLTAIAKRWRDQYGVLIKPTTLGASDNVSLYQRIPAVGRMSPNRASYMVSICGPTDYTVKVGWGEALETVTCLGVQGALGGAVVEWVPGTEDDDPPTPLTAQAGGASTITLHASDSKATNGYTGRWIEITGGTGVGQMARISSNDSGSKVLTVDIAWVVQPDNTSTYKIADAPKPTVAHIKNNVPTLSTTYLDVYAFTSPSAVGTYIVLAAQFQWLHGSVAIPEPWLNMEEAVERIRDGRGTVTDLTIVTSITIPNTGLHVLDTDASHDLIFKPGSNLTADRTLTITTGDANRTLDISAGSVTIGTYGASITAAADASAARTLLGLGTAAVGNASNTAAAALGASASAGVSADLSRVDHVHQKQLESIVIAASDETTILTSGVVHKVLFRMPYAFTVTAVRASLSVAQTSGSVVTVDINESNTSILSTKLTFDNGEATTTTAATPAVISDTSLADDAEISIDIDQVGDGTAKGLKVYLIGRQAT